MDREREVISLRALNFAPSFLGDFLLFRTVPQFLNGFASLCAAFFLLGPIAGFQQGFAEEPQEAVHVEHPLFHTTGTVCPQYRSMLGTQVAGYVEEVCVEVGDSVTKGQVLVRLDPTYFSIAVAEAEAVVASARVEEADAAKDFERMKKLFDKPEGETPSISQKRYEDAKRRLDQSHITVCKAGESLRRAGRSRDDACIKAPFDGVITKRCVSPGEPVTVTPVSEIIEVLSTHQPYVEFSVPQQYLQAIHKGTEIEVKVEGASMEKFSVRIDRIYPDIDEKTRAFKCRATLPDSLGMYSGALSQISISLQGE